MIKNIEKLSLTHYVGRFNIHKADNCPPGFFSVQAVYLFDMQPFVKTQKQYWVKKVKKKKINTKFKSDRSQVCTNNSFFILHTETKLFL